MGLLISPDLLDVETLEVDGDRSKDEAAVTGGERRGKQARLQPRVDGLKWVSRLCEHGIKPLCYHLTTLKGA